MGDSGHRRSRSITSCFARLAERFPQKVAARLEFSNPLAHRIEAGADMFLMPSRYEPCGLNQLYSLKYGTVPVVRATGGLADTITDANDDTAGRRNGQRVQLPRVQRAGPGRDAAPRAVDAYAKPEVWRRMVATGMRQDWSWARSARQYVDSRYWNAPDGPNSVSADRFYHG